MAGNFWQSSHCAQWVLDRVDLARERKADLEVGIAPALLLSLILKPSFSF